MSRIFQIVWVCTGILLILLAVGILNSSSTLLTRLDFLHELPPICLPLDLSSQGVYSGRYKRDFPAVLDDQLRLVIADSPSVEETKTLLSGLTILIVLRNESGEVVSEQVVGAPDFHPWNAGDNSGLVITLPLEKAEHQAGNYHLSIEVKTPAKNMAGHPHCLVAELGLCNAEGVIAEGIMIPAAWITLLLGIIVLVARRRKQEKAPGAERTRQVSP